MPRLQRKSFEKPDELRTFATGQLKVVTLDEVAVGRFLFQPGWRWTKDVGPIAGTRRCGLRHLGYTISGSLHVELEDGTELTIGPGDAYEIPPGHDAWVVGDQPWDSVEFTSGHAYGLSPHALGERVLATILFTDIVGSTGLVQRLGDHAWAGLLREHNTRIRAMIDRFRGREIDAAGDGFLAVFDGAARAVNAGAQMDRAVSDLALRVRVGVHTSEVEFVGGQARGVGVHTAARVASLAGAGEVLVSGTTHDLLDGSGLAFDHRGDHELKGLSGLRPIFALKRD
jgi:class 3 adenylate cyclase